MYYYLKLSKTLETRKVQFLQYSINVKNEIVIKAPHTIKELLDSNE
jgi:hypothetical protein